MIIYIERKFLDIVNSNSIIDEFNSQKFRKTELKYYLIVIELLLKFDVFSYVLMKFSLKFIFLIAIIVGLGKNLAHPKFFSLLHPCNEESKFQIR